MTDDELLRDLTSTLWGHIEASRFEQAELAIRQLMERTDPEDAVSRWSLFGLLAGVFNGLQRPKEGTEAYRQALAEARKADREVDVARYMLATQLLIYDDPAEALAEAEPVPAGTGHVQCLLHAVAAQALWKLKRHEEARTAAQSAMQAAPTDERRADVTAELAQILKAG